MKNKYIVIFVLSLLFTGCSLDEIWYDKVVPETFFQSETDIKAALYRPFTHARWYVANDRWRVQEFSADQFTISTKGRHWYNGGVHERYLYHQWTEEEGWIWDTWRGTLMGVALALDTKQDLSKLDYSEFALSEEIKQDHLAQLDALIAYFYMRGLDFFGGLPIFTSLDQENLPRNSDQETFDHVESLLLSSIEKLPVKEAGQLEEGALTKGAAAMMLAQLYFNAEAYVGEAMFDKAAELSEAIINEEYGPYSLDSDWKAPLGFDNDRSPEVIWSMPSEFNRLQYDWFYSNFYHYNSRQYFDVDMGNNNGIHMQPSRRPNTTLYKDQFKLGSPYEKFDDGDLRKRPYKYFGNGDYEGMFLVGEQISPITGVRVLGNEEYRDKLLVFKDIVGRLSEVGPGKTYSSLDEVPSKLSEGEENTGVRLVKVPIPSNKDLSLRWGADHALFRLSEVYYMLAESKLRLGDAAAAASLINEVRKRNFEGENDPNPVTAANLDLYRLADEWGVEFLGEGRRRTDLIRLGFFTTEAWWDHKPSNSDHLKRFPVPQQALSGNNSLDQNPGY